MKILAPRRLIAGAIAAMLLAALPAVSGGQPAFACSTSPCTGNQTTSVNVNGALTVSAASLVSFGSAAPGTTTGATAVGELDYTNTLGSGNPWSVTVASTDMIIAGGAAPPCTPGGGCISFTNLNFAPGSTFATGQTGQTCTGNATTGMTAGTAGSFSGTDGGTPGTTFSSPLTVMSGAASGDQGCFRQTGSTTTLTLPTGLKSGSAYQGTFQYTITG